MTTEIILSCKKCGTSFSVFGKKNIKTFCSRKCANSRTWTEEDKKKKSVALKNSSKAKLVAQKRILLKTEKICSCGKSFFVLPCKMQQQYCSTRCSDQYKIKAGGGYRERSGRSKSGYYKGIYCGSTYELCWVIYNLDHNISFQRFPGYIANEQIKYYPDFLLNEKHIIEIKGYENKEKVQAKCDLAKQKGYDIKVLYKNDLKPYFEHVKLKYGTKKFHTLYDGYKPSYTYECCFCLTSFNTEKQRKGSVLFCGKSCAIKFNRLKCPKFNKAP
jgi:hypothetical protein